MLKVKQIFLVMAAVVSIGCAALTVGAQVKPERVGGAPTSVGVIRARRNHATGGRHYQRGRSRHRRHKRVPNAKSLKNESY